LHYNFCAERQRDVESLTVITYLSFDGRTTRKFHLQKMTIDAVNHIRTSRSISVLRRWWLNMARRSVHMSSATICGCCRC